MEATMYLTELEIQFKYILIGNKATIELAVDHTDVLVNADGDLDCPLDTVLRKNDYSLTHLNEWQAKVIRFVKVFRNQEEIIHEIVLNQNL
ncbi:hypothetical protein [Lacticigenium naphthae]|uniref:hypothetical protein n=1 Tax=Lacticigenium naphthae TaxID=515351 RepID=UPI00041B4A8D|nr:hypothetical protein [Lacticigenium naphthae]